MVFYFTGTGNSLYVAKRLDHERVSIPQVLNETALEFTAERIGIVCPIYGHEMPRMVKDFLKKVTFETDYFFIVLTYGNRHGGCVELTQEYLHSIGKTAQYINHILMVDNFLPGFDMTEQIASAPEKKIEDQIAAILSDIQEKKPYYGPVTDEERAAHREFLRNLQVHPQNYQICTYLVSDDCIGCGICSRVCPAGCIRIEGQRAVHTGENCQLCMACIHHCPQKAIGLSIPEKNPDARFHNEHIRLTEIVAANDQTLRK